MLGSVAFFDDMLKALEEYPTTDVDLEIVDVDILGEALDAGETVAFRVRITNRGPLNLTDTKVHVYGQNGALVAHGGAATPFVSDFISDTFEDILGHGGSQLSPGAPFKLKAPPTAQPVKVLVKATLDEWKANLDHILTEHSDPLPVPRATYAVRVAPSRHARGTDTPMTPETIHLVRASFAQVVPIADVASNLFYDRLFELDPSLRPLFARDMAQQKHALIATLKVAVEKLDQPHELVPILEQLGARHVAYGVKQSHYATVGAALLWTLEQGLGPAFTPAVRAAWTSVFEMLASTMQRPELATTTP
jgi:hemoglobin-like flavoprotein